MHVVHVVDAFARNHHSVVNCGIDAHKDVVLGHYPLTRAVYQLHFAINLLDAISAGVHVLKAWLNCFDVLTETLVHANETLVHLDVGVIDTTYEARYVTLEASTAFTAMVKIGLVGSTKL